MTNCKCISLMNLFCQISWEESLVYAMHIDRGSIDTLTLMTIMILLNIFLNYVISYFDISTCLSHLCYHTILFLIMPKGEIFIVWSMHDVRGSKRSLCFHYIFLCIVLNWCMMSLYCYIFLCMVCHHQKGGECWNLRFHT